MIKKLFFLPVFLLSVSTVFAQSNMFERVIQGTGGQQTDTLDNGTIVTLDLSTDDVEQINNEVDGRFDDDLDVGWEGEPADQNVLHLGFRFVNLPLLQGTTIDSAFIVFHAHEGKTASDVAELTIAGEATDNALTFDATNFNDNFLLTDRPQTTAEVSWTVNVPWTIWQPYQTPDIKSIIQEIVDRPNWTSGNAIALFLFGEDQGPSVVENAREITSFENIADPDDQDPQGNPGDGTNHPEWRPKLVVYVDGILSTEDLILKQVKLYPNPAKDGTIRVELASDAPTHFDLINAYGQKVRGYNVDSDKVNLDITKLKPGVYMLNGTQANKSFSHKFVIQ